MMESNDADKPLQEESDDIPAGAASEEAVRRDAEVQSVATSDMELPLPENLDNLYNDSCEIEDEDLENALLSSEVLADDG